MAGRNAPDPAPTATTAATTTTAGAGVPADGCLGGPVVGPEMVLTAQQTADLTPEGATATAAAFFRWVGLDGYPPHGEVEQVVPALVSEDGSPAAGEMLRISAERVNPDVRTGQALTTIDGRYYIERVDGSGAVTVTLMLTRPAPEQDGSYRSSSTFTLDSSSGSWIITSIEATRTMEDIASIGQAFAGGC